MAALKSDRGRLAMIDSELDFLRHLKQNQPPYIDALYLISRSVPPGTKLDTLSLSRRGELALRGTFQNANQVAEFRSKLLDSGFFSNIALEEQTPSPDRQKLTARLSATWRSDQMKETATELAAKEPEKPKGASSLTGGGPMMMGGDMPPGAFPGGGVRMTSGSFPPGMTLPPGAVPIGMEGRTSGATTQRVGTVRTSPPGMVSPPPDQPAATPTTPMPVPAPQLRSPNP